MADVPNKYPDTGDEWVELRERLGALSFMYYQEAVRVAEVNEVAMPLPFSMVTWDKAVVERLLGMGAYIYCQRAMADELSDG